MTGRLFEDNTAGVGFTFTTPASNLEYWINSWKEGSPLLDIGCGHGVNTKRALERGAQVVAADITLPSLFDHPNLQCAVARLPDHIPFDDNFFSGILCAEVFHFLQGDQVIPTIKELHRILQPEGNLVITCVSSKIEVLKPTGIHQQIQAAKQKDPDAFHGYNDYIALLEQAALHFNKPEITTPIVEAHSRNVPGRFFNFFIAEQLSKALEKAGFRIIQCEYGAAPHYPVWSHGEWDQVRIVAQK